MADGMRRELRDRSVRDRNLRYDPAMATYTLSEGRPIFGELIRRASHGREHITITDRGHAAAVILGAAEYEAMASALEDLEDELALARHRAREAAGDTSGRVSAAEARRILGLSDAA
jgi:prevent-host-death family protein